MAKPMNYARQIVENAKAQGNIDELSQFVEDNKEGIQSNAETNRQQDTKIESVKQDLATHEAKKASSSVLGHVKVVGNASSPAAEIKIASNDTLVCEHATVSRYGAVKLGTANKNSGDLAAPVGETSGHQLTVRKASTTQSGVVVLADNMDDTGETSVPTASTVKAYVDGKDYDGRYFRLDATQPDAFIGGVVDFKSSVNFESGGYWQSGNKDVGKLSANETTFTIEALEATVSGAAMDSNLVVRSPATTVWGKTGLMLYAGGNFENTITLNSTGTTFNKVLTIPDATAAGHAVNKKLLDAQKTALETKITALETRVAALEAAGTQTTQE